MALRRFPRFFHTNNLTLARITATTADFSYIRFDRLDDYEWWAKTVRKTLPHRQKLYTYMNYHYAGHSLTSLKTFQKIYNQHKSDA